LRAAEGNPQALLAALAGKHRPWRGNRRLNHAIHTAAVSQVRCRYGDGSACRDNERAERQDPEEALRVLSRRTSGAVFVAPPG